MKISSKKIHNFNIQQTQGDDGATLGDKNLLPYIAITTDAGKSLNIVLDITSHFSCISVSATSKLNVIARQKVVRSIRTISSKTEPKPEFYDLLKVDLITPTFTRRFTALQLQKIAPLADKVRHQELPDDLRLVPGLHKNCYVKGTEVDLLIGLPDALHFISKIENVQSYPNLFRLLTPWGWIYAGKTTRDDSDSKFVDGDQLDQNDLAGNEFAKNSNGLRKTRNQNFLSTMEKLVNVLERFSEIERLSFDDQTQLTRDDIDCLRLLEDNFQYDKSKKRFTVPICFKSQPVLPNNCKTVLAQFFGQEKRLKKPGMDLTRKLYNEHIEEGFQKGLFEYCSEAEAERAQDRTRDDVYFVPHHFVEKLDSESTSLRPVWNFSYATPVLGENHSKRI